MNRSLDIWPDRHHEMLLKAALLNNKNDALAAWRKWTAEPVIDAEAKTIFPLLYQRLQKWDRTETAPDILQETYRTTWFRNQQTFHVAKEIIHALNQAGIEMMLIKGAALIADYYHNHRLRPMYDVDVLIHLEQVETAINTITKLGLEVVIPLPYHRIPLIHGTSFRKDNHIDFDLHWYLLEECCFPGADTPFWESAHSVEFLGESVKSLSPTVLLINVCIHGLRWEVTRPIKWVADALFILRQSSISWEQLTTIVSERELTVPMLEGLQYLREVYQAPIPINAIESLSTVPVSYTEKLEFAVKAKRRTYWRRLLFHWFNYRRLKHMINARNDLFGFQRYLRWRWGVKNLWHMPRFIWQQLHERAEGGYSNIALDDPVQKLFAWLNQNRFRETKQ